MPSLKTICRRWLGFEDRTDTMFRWHENMFYEINHPALKLCYPRVANAENSLNILLTQKKSLCRIGDGEFDCIFRKKIGYQNADALLAKRLAEILRSTDPDIMVGIPDRFGDLSAFSQRSIVFWRGYLGKRRQAIYQLLDMDKQYYDTNMTRPYFEYEDKSAVPEYFKRFTTLWDQKNVLVVEGAQTKFGIGNDLLGNAASVRRIAAPPKNAWAKYDQILALAAEKAGDALVLAALGPTATVLCYDLAKKGIQAIDIGHLDIEYEWCRSAAKEKHAIPGKYTNEASKNKAGTSILETEFRNQVVGIID